MVKVQMDPNRVLSGDNLKRQREGQSHVSPEGRTAWVTETRSWFHLEAGRGGRGSVTALPPNAAANVLKVGLKEADLLEISTETDRKPQLQHP